MKKSQTIVLVTGVFNIIHPGHLRLLYYAKDLGSHLFVGVYSDRISKNNSYVSQNLRVDNIKSLSFVNEVFLIESDISDLILKIRPDIIVKGKEFENLFNPELEVLESYGGKLLFSSGDSNFSSFDLINFELSSQKSIKSIDIPNNFTTTHSIKLKNLKSIIEKFRNLKVLVIGDLIIDEYITCDPLGMSQEDPTLVVSPVDKKLYVGGAGIVAAHAAGLGANVNFITICGEDQFSEFASKMLVGYNVKANLIIDKSRPTTVKQRYRSKGKTLLRVSYLNQNMINTKLQNSIFEEVASMINNIDLIVFSDFNYGCLPTDLINKISYLAKSKNILIAADSQSSSQFGDISRFQNMDLITPTEREARISLKDQECGLIVLMERLQKQSLAKNIILTLGENGILIYTANSKQINNFNTDNLPALNVNPIDVAGAGDSMFISTSLAMCSGANIWESSLIGSMAASIQVARIGNIPLSYEDLLFHL